MFVSLSVVICLKRRADCLHMVQPMPLPSKTATSVAWFKSRLTFPLWYRFTQVILEKRPLNGCTISQLDLPHGTELNKWKRKTKKLNKKRICSEVSVNSPAKNRKVTVGRICRKGEVSSLNEKSEGVVVYVCSALKLLRYSVVLL